MYKFLALLPAILSFIGFVIHLLWKNRNESPVVTSIVNTIHSKSVTLPELDSRISAKGVYNLLNKHPELREKLSKKDYDLLQYVLKSESKKDYLYGALTLILVGISVFGYLKIEEYQNRLTISDVRLGAVYGQETYEVPTTRDDLKISWNYAGNAEEFDVKITCINNSKSIDGIKGVAQDGSLKIDNETLSDLWECPNLNDDFQIRVTIQTLKDLYSFGPFNISTALTILYHFNNENNNLEIMTQTMNCGLLQVDYDLKAIAWAKNEAQIESLDIHVINGKGQTRFPTDFVVDESTLKLVNLGDYPNPVIRFQRL